MERKYIDVESSEVEYYVIDSDAYFNQFSLLDFASRYIKNIIKVSENLYEFSFFDSKSKRLIIATIDEKNHKSYCNKNKSEIFDLLYFAGFSENFENEVKKLYGVDKLEYAVECVLNDGTKFQRKPKGIWKSI